jgi:hypothetical protein
MTEGAYVGSFEAVRDFRAALHTFLQEAREAMCSNDLEVRRTLEWLLEAQPKHWQQQVRNCEEAVVEAKIELERCRSSSLPGGGTPSCTEERKALERARQRRQWAEQKVESVRKWGYVVGREAEEYTGRANQLAGLFDADLPQAIAILDRVLNALESYAALNVQGPAPLAASGPGFSQEPVARSRPIAVEPATAVPAAPHEAPQAALEEAGDDSAPRRSVS